MGGSESTGEERWIAGFRNNNVTVKQIEKFDFCMELLVDFEDEGIECWVIFVHASTDAMVRQSQWEWLKGRRSRRGSMWIMGGDFNDIKDNGEKKGGKEKTGG